MAEKINIEGREISIKKFEDQDYISLTDIARERDAQDPSDIIRTWLNNSSTVRYLEVWEREENPNFKPGNFARFKNEALEGVVRVRVQEYIKSTGAIGIISKSGRYGGTFAHNEIAFEFASWIEPVFKYNLYKEFKRLRSDEYKRQKLEWNAGRELARLNYPLQTGAIKETTGSLKDSERGGAYANEADMINFIVFGMTAKQWRAKNPAVKGNIRDTASTAQNVVLANLESFNAELIRKGASVESREKALGDMAVYQFEILNQKYLPE